jgi:hypothetical protein
LLAAAGCAVVFVVRFLNATDSLPSIDALPCKQNWPDDIQYLAATLFPGSKKVRSSTTIPGMEIQKRGFQGPAPDPWQKALDYGIDTGRLEVLLTLSPAERLRRHDVVRPLIIAARQAGIQYYGFDPRLTEAAE